jgi:hypothetical protein
LKKSIITLIFLSGYLLTHAQTNLPDSVDLNLINAPSNPAFNLMGVSISSIDKPTDLNSFRLSIQNASNRFTKFPSNYAVEFSPASIFSRKSQTLTQFNSTKFSDVWRQSLSVSFAYTKSNAEDKETDDSTSFTKFGIGFKVSLVRPRWNDETMKKVDSFYNFQRKALDAYNKRVAQAKNIFNGVDSALTAAFNEPVSDARTKKITALTGQRDSLGKVLDAVINSEINDPASKSALAAALVNLNKYAKGLKVERKGAFLDFAAGLALDFPDNSFNNSFVSKAGAWLTGGYEGGNNAFSFLGIARYLFQPDKIYADDSGKIRSKDISTFDAGARLSISGYQGKFNLSAEAVYRSVLNDNVIKPSYRLTFNAEYSVGFNQKITLAIGRNFDGTVTKAGNLIAALNFIRGFGSNKKISPN